MKSEVHSLDCPEAMSDVRERQRLYPHMLQAAKEWLYLVNHQIGATEAEKLAGFALSVAAKNVRKLPRDKKVAAKRKRRVPILVRARQVAERFRMYEK